MPALTHCPASSSQGVAHNPRASWPAAFPRFRPTMTSKLFSRFVVLGALALVSPSLWAQSANVQRLADQEVQRQEVMRNHAEKSVQKGHTAMQQRDYESAFSYFKSAVDALPVGGTMVAPLRQEALQGLTDASVSLSEQRISEGRTQDALTTINLVLEDRYNPDDQRALALQKRLMDPGRFNPALTPAFIANVEEVKQLLLEADGFYQSGRFDLAFKRYEQVLNIDRYNIAARRGQELVNHQRTQYARQAYNEARGDMLRDVSKSWGLPVRRFNTEASSVIEQPTIDSRGTASINRKLDEIIVPNINLNDATIREALEFLRQRSAALDTTETDPSRKGINLLLKLAPGTSEEDLRINLSLGDVPLRTAIEYVASAANMKLKVEPYAVVVVPESEQTDVLIVKQWKVSPSFIQNIPADTGGSFAPSGGGVSSTAPGSTSSIAARSGAKEFLESNGVPFPEGATANFFPNSSRLVAKNTQANLDLIDALVEASGNAPATQVEIESKFLEVTQNNLEELGFDWLLGQFAMPFGTGVYGGGGTTPGGVPMGGPITSPTTGLTTGNTSWPMLNPGMSPVGSTGTTQGPLTGGTRSGTSAISVNAIDALLFATPAGPAPAVLALAGVFTNPQFQVVLRALSQKKGVDLVSSPKVTTKSGQRATIDIVREFRYPAEYDLPQISATQGAQYAPVVPTTPTSFETKNVGITLEVEPTVAADNFSINLNLAPRVVEFEGFINYGSPIYASVAGVLGVVGTPPMAVLAPSATILATPNVINRPVFSTREVTTEVTVYDGQTVVLGGLLREDIQKVQDKVPILGDIPLAGRLFRTTASQHIKRNLIMFVTASLLDPAGQPVIQVDEEEQDAVVPNLKGISEEAISGDAMSIPLPQ